MHVVVTASEYAGCDLLTEIIVTVLCFMMTTIQDHCSYYITSVKHKIKLYQVNFTFHSFSALLGTFSAW